LVPVWGGPFGPPFPQRISVDFPQPGELTFRPFLGSLHDLHLSCSLLRLPASLRLMRTEGRAIP
jgi:hypothetical protein